jgi:ATP-dependent Clp protease ATP-binding subunit ClpA
MFDRYNDEAKRALFFARMAVSQHGGAELEPEHLLIGLLRAQPEATLRFAPAALDADDLCERLAAAITDKTRPSKSIEVRLSAASIAALEQAKIEADDLSSVAIRPEHLILGIMVKTDGAAATALRDAGARPSAIREYLSSAEGE